MSTENPKVVTRERVNGNERLHSQRSYLVMKCRPRGAFEDAYLQEGLVRPVQVELEQVPEQRQRPGTRGLLPPGLRQPGGRRPGYVADEQHQRGSEHVAGAQRQEGDRNVHVYEATKDAPELLGVRVTARKVTAVRLASTRKVQPTSGRGATGAQIENVPKVLIRLFWKRKCGLNISESITR